MAIDQPRLRPVESFPIRKSNGEVRMVLRDPAGFAQAIEIPEGAARLASLLDGQRQTADIQRDYQQRWGEPLHPADLADLLEKLDERNFLDSPRFRARWKSEVETYLNAPTRPAAHAGRAYAAGGAELTAQLDALFSHPEGPGARTAQVNDGAPDRLLGVLSPHIDFARGGPAFAWAYRQIVEHSDADLFVIFGTAHQWTQNVFSVSRKHFDTPLGVVETDKRFVGQLGQKLAAEPGGKELNLFADELAHRTEHSIEFQVVFLQHILGERRPFKVAPILVRSFREYVVDRRLPITAAPIRAFVNALRAAVAEHAGKVCFISGGDLAHIGPRFGDRQRLDRERLERQAEDDRRLLAAACRADSAAFFQHVAAAQDGNRICGLSPTYAMLEAMQPRHGKLLTYGQANDPSGASCVSFGSLAFYGD